MPRLIGAAALLLLSVYTGASLAAMEKKRLRQTEGFLLLVRYIREQISCFRRPLPAIYASFSNEALHSAGFLPALAEGDFSSALAEAREGLYLEEEEFKLLFGFGESVGQSFEEEQRALCAYTERELEKALARRREEVPKRVRVLRTLCAVFGGMIVILLL
ncbi:MAG: stage III sporulation protein AB [Clostridia bacterium]|nr:stage III sporulation protein AB [Clostridia bacterium]